MKKTIIAFALSSILFISISCQSNDCERYRQNMVASAQSTLVHDENVCEGNPECLALMVLAHEERLTVAENCYQCCVNNSSCATCPPMAGN